MKRCTQQREAGLLSQVRALMPSTRLELSLVKAASLQPLQEAGRAWS